jgi:hypothetical protein
MLKQRSLRLFAVIFIGLVLDVPLIAAAKHRPSKQGSPTTRPTRPTQPTPNPDAAKLSYGNQGPPQGQAPAPGFNQPPPPYQQHAGPPAGYPQNPPAYGAQPGYHPPGPGYQQAPMGQQPVIVNHVQQPQSGGGLGVGSGLAIGK